MSFLLASASPRRRELLEAAGFVFDVDAVDVDERRLLEESPDAYVERVALLKVRAGLRRHPERVILAADTAVVLDRAVFGKPEDARDAARMLAALAGRAHDVLTGVAVASAEREEVFVECTTVWFSPLSETDIDDYVASREPMDKAGAYAIQGLASRFVLRIAGSYTNVVGLPVARTWELLRRFPGMQVASFSGGPYPE